MTELRRNVGTFGAASVGIANIIGAGIFVLSGVAAGMAGPAVILSFLVAGIIAMMTALSAAELSSFITETGASYAYTKRAFGRFWSFLVGWFKYFDYIVGAAAVSVGFAAYFTSVFGLEGPMPIIIAAVGLPIILCILNLIGIKEAARVTSAMVLIKVFAIVILLMVGGFFLTQHFEIGNYTPFFATGFGGMLNASAVIFFAFIGFNTVTMMSEEVKKPEKTIPRALMIAFGVTFVLYLSVAVLEIGVLDWTDLSQDAHPLGSLALAVSENQMFFDFISFSALIATGSVVLSNIIGGTRASFAMGRDRLLPHHFDKISKKFGTPHISILIGGAIIVTFAGVFYNDINTIASIVNFGSLFTYLFVNLSLLKLRKTEPNANRLFKVPLYPVVPIVGAISCVGLMYYLADEAKFVSLIWAMFGLILYFTFYRKRAQNSQK
ncbi:putative amino acid-proton symporter YbeC protein [Marine Group I thaumarchaeote SCGC AAA799-E16]|uniref:Amino acid permease-associated protein n=3 Tax=Marine Group I TaxID=905826 RepID=A0A087RY73_9ARCH|nr:putative amino acid-proton symporter YbeC protein [Marine Group I thaumarchaeote SCGC AAA799-E16]KFM18427.1 amino acid permease-associated protein [Marine Group I thaumarchaeote SCGC RSA3]KFM22312.1 putative amino acid-proton symporter YbeC protein [Marine Group I thaumarchaeote SCGC AAA799-B03]